MLRLTRARRDLLAEALRDLANLSAGALVLGQFVGQQPLSWGLMFVGVTTWLVLLVIAIAFTKGERA
jgi:hypothetical protein